MSPLINRFSVCSCAAPSRNENPYQLIGALTIIKPRLYNNNGNDVYWDDTNQGKGKLKLKVTIRAN